MRCETILDLLILEADGEADAEETRLIETHVHACDACRRERARTKREWSSLLALVSPSSDRSAHEIDPTFEDHPLENDSLETSLLEFSLPSEDLAPEDVSFESSLDKASGDQDSADQDSADQGSADQDSVDQSSGDQLSGREEVLRALSSLNSETEVDLTDSWNVESESHETDNWFVAFSQDNPSQDNPSQDNPSQDSPTSPSSSPLDARSSSREAMVQNRLGFLLVAAALLMLVGGLAMFVNDQAPQPAETRLAFQNPVAGTVSGNDPLVVVRNGETLEISQGDRIYQNDLIWLSDASTAWELQDGSVIMGSQTEDSSEARLRVLDGRTLAIEQGAIVLSGIGVNLLTPDERMIVALGPARFEYRTPSSSVDSDGSVTAGSVRVDSGEILVISPNGTRRLKAGYQGSPDGDTEGDANEKEPDADFSPEPDSDVDQDGPSEDRGPNSQRSGFESGVEDDPQAQSGVDVGTDYDFNGDEEESRVGELQSEYAAVLFVVRESRTNDIVPQLDLVLSPIQNGIEGDYEFAPSDRSQENDDVPQWKLTTDDRGFAYLPMIPPGPYHVTAVFPESQLRQDLDTVVLSTGPQLIEAWTLPILPSVSFQIITSDSTPLPDHIQLFLQGRSLGQFDAQGKLTVSNVLQGEYDFDVQLGDHDQVGMPIEFRFDQQCDSDCISNQNNRGFTEQFWTFDLSNQVTMIVWPQEAGWSVSSLRRDSRDDSQSQTRNSQLR